MSLKSQLLELAKRRNGFINVGEFERYAMDNGFKSSNASRRLRELAKEGILEVRYNERHCVEYRYKPMEIPKPEMVLQNKLI